MTKSLYELTGLSASTPKAELARAVEARMDAAFSQAEAGDERARQELAELRFSYLVWAYGAQDCAGQPSPAAGERSPERSPKYDGIRRGGERRRYSRRKREAAATAGLRCLDRRNGERREDDSYRFAPAYAKTSVASSIRREM
jgi:hypothetical protein